MKITELKIETVKDYLRVEDDVDDVLISLMLSSSKSFIETYLNQKFVDMEDVPVEFTIAALSLISHWYGLRAIQRDKQSYEILYNFSGILDPHRVKKL